MKVLAGSANPWKNPQETRFLRNFQHNLQVIPQENRKFLVVKIVDTQEELLFFGYSHEKNMRVEAMQNRECYIEKINDME